MKENRAAILVSLLLFFLPFFWFVPGAMDLGGDGSRLYFYDPVAFIKHVGLYSLNPEGKAEVNPSNHAYLPYVLLIAGINYITHSPSTVISIFNGLKLSVGFLSIYFIVKEFIGVGRREEVPAILAGVFYTVASGSEKLIFHWVKSLHSHDQIFLNPLVFFLLLRYLLTRNRWYLLGCILVSFIFSTSFSMISAPPFFAFYPLALTFLLLYVTLIRKIKIPFKEISISLLFFLGLHAFHLVPEFLAVFHNNTFATSVVFKESGENYFMAIRGLGLAIVNLFVPSPVVQLRWTSLVGPLVIILGGLGSWRKNKELVLISVFFFITFFLVTANITHTGIELYRRFFLIPGFSMFRNFYLQWAYVFIFFYALLFGESLALIFHKLKAKYFQLVAVVVTGLFVIGFWPFLSGQQVDGIHWGSNGVKTAMVMDSRYEEALAFIHNLPEEGKILILPLTDNYIQVLFGTNNAAYAGPASIPFLTGKKSFAGYQNFWPDPIPEEILAFAREKNYEALAQIFSLFNIRYIFHNTDPKIYEEKFPQFPNSYMMTSLPKTQESYKEFVKNFPIELRYHNGPYELYELDSKTYRSEVYIPDTVYIGDMLQVIKSQNISFHSAFIDAAVCKQNQVVLTFCNGTYEPPRAVIDIKKMNPTEYILHIKQSDGPSPFLLIFQNSYHGDWKASIDQKSPLPENKHLLVNKYANAWIITRDDRNGKDDYTVHLQLSTQRYFWYGLWITGASFVALFALVLATIIYKNLYGKS